MPFFNLCISLPVLLCLGIALLAGIIALFWGLAPQRRVGKEPLWSYDTSSDSSSVSDESVIADESHLPSVSVIAYTPEDYEMLDEFIDSVRNQKYPGALEIILVLDAPSDTREILVEKYADISRLYLTFIPPGSQNLSRRKLAITLGMKAAKGEVALLTTAICRIPSDEWILEMMRPFIENENTDAVLGLCMPDSVGARGLKGAYRRWYSANTAMQWIGYALSDRAYRGDGFNLAFRRSVFFAHKGFANTISLQGGDDDLFINEISSQGNISVVLHPSTMLTAMWGEAAGKVWTDRRESYDFTSRLLPRRPFLQSGSLSLCQWILLGGCVAASVLAFPNLLVTLVSFLMLVGFFVGEILIWSRGHRVITPGGLAWATPIFLLWKPVGNCFFRWRHRSERVKNYTWRRPHTQM